jgi:hypothetical protein
MAPQRLTSELVDTAVADYRHTTERAANLYQRGMLTDDEGCRLVERAFYDAFWALLKRNNLKFDLNAANYEQCKKEFQNYLAGMGLSNAAHATWLFDVENEPEEATKEDQRFVFSLMEHMDISPSFFEPIPDSVVKPNKTYCHTYHSASSISISFECIDDGGLLRDDNPIGKTFTLVNTLGLKAEVTIKEDRRKEDRAGMDFDEMVCQTERGMCVVKAEFLAEGDIEGYTAKDRSGNRKVLIRLKSPDRVDSLSYWENEEDHAAYYNYPLWQEYLKEMDKRQRKNREHCRSLLKSPIKV